MSQPVALHSGAVYRAGLAGVPTPPSDTRPSLLKDVRIPASPRRFCPVPESAWPPFIRMLLPRSRLGRWGPRASSPRHHGAGREQLRHLRRDASQVRVAGLERGPHSLPPVGPGSLPRQPRPPADKASGKPCGVQGVPQPAPPRPPPPSRPPAAARAATRAPWSPRGRPLPGDMFAARPSSDCAPVTRASR